MNAATAATESPAIWAGVILGRSSFAAGATIEVGADEAVDVAVAGCEIESTKTDWLEDILVCTVVPVMDVMDALEVDVVDHIEERDVVLGMLLGTTVRAVLVGKTASFWPRQML